MISGTSGADVLLDGPDNLVVGNLIGTNIMGKELFNSTGQEIDGGTGVEFGTGGSQNTVGGLTTTPGTGPGNVISGNSFGIVDSASGGNLIEGNLIGTNPTGLSVVANFDYGIEVFASSDTIGGTVAGAGQRDLRQPG